MKIVYFLALISSVSLTAQPKGSVHDAWSDWITEHQIGIDNEEAELSEDDNVEPEQETFSG